MTEESKVKFVNYEFREQVTSEYNCKTNAIQLPADAIKQIPLETINKPKLLINIYDGKNPNTNYINTINHPKLKDALFVYLSNEGNSGYAGGSGGGTAQIGKYVNTFGIITGILNNTSKITSGGFQNLEETNTFKLCHHADKKTYDVTPKQAIDYLLGQLYELIQEKKYRYLILPCDVVNQTLSDDDYHKYTLGAGIFNAHSTVKQYIYDKICEMTKASSGRWELVTDFLK